MKRLIILGMSLVMGLTIASCKKGENDPAISLKSRDSRITGEWNLKNISGDFITQSENIDGEIETYKQSISYDNGVITITDNDGDTESSQYLFELDILDDQSFTLLNKITYDDTDFEEYSVSDQWYWLDGVKNKSQIFLPGFNEVTFFGYDDALIIDRLTNKEMHLKINTSYGMDDSFSGVDNEEFTLLLEFEKK